MDAASFGFAKPSSPVVTLRLGGRERSLQLRPATLIAGALVLAALLMTGLGAAAYLLFHDHVVAAVLRHQAATEAAYEDRIAALRLQIDRIATKQVLETDGVAAQVEALAKQHSALSDAGARLDDLVRKARATGLAAGTDDTALPRQAAPATPPLKTSLIDEPMADRVTALLRDADAVGRRQVAVARHLAEGAATSVDLIATTMDRLGLAADRVAARPVLASAGGVGGPYVPADASPDAAIGRAAQLLDRLDTLRRRLATLPLRRPLAGDLTITSGFGTRQDPFLGGLALHTGIDFRAADGTPVLATAPGTVEATGRQGGYGLAIDIDHGGGVSTRYGHLSRIAVSVGQHIATGDTIGYAGSTGRSTGPHLHYETRVNGEAVDPTDWLQAGERLTAFLD
jgi:murein DD-endopeptidase MepM/ murein hydrolase activator NlpD